MNKPEDLSNIYNLRNNFTVIGLTGQIGSGCSEIAEQLSKGFNDKDFESPREIGTDKTTLKIVHNSYRKYRIVYNYARDNFKSFERINYKDVLVLFLLQNSFEDFINFLESNEVRKELLALKLSNSFESEIEELKNLKINFESLSDKYSSIDVMNLKMDKNCKKLYEFYFKSDFLSFCKKFHEVLKKHSLLKRNKILQIISTNLRKSGKPFESSDISADNIFTIVKVINYIIKSFRQTTGEGRTQFVIDDLRNPMEIMYLKQRFAAFYTIASSRDYEERDSILHDKYGSEEFEQSEEFFKEEYKSSKAHEFYKANISDCIQQADIHISFLTSSQAKDMNDKISKENNVSCKTKTTTPPYFSWQVQLLKYISLISHPGLITPTPEERCMQMAFTAKHNSGCVSRHVGAAITDENFSIKAVGWNDAPLGHVPCVLRNAEDLLNQKNDIDSFTKFERENTKFFLALNENFRNQINDNKQKLKGRNVCFCFKDIKNSLTDGKNQVHTRSLHAEENAFLQIVKYGGTGIENGKLFTTASPCELCAKKAYQLGIKEIYYIDPYPGISDDQILLSGSKSIKPRLFNGAIGKAYHWLYDPIMSYKDELTLLLGNKINDYATQQNVDNEELKKEIVELRKENKRLKKKIIVRKKYV